MEMDEAFGTSVAEDISTYRFFADTQIHTDDWLNAHLIIPAEFSVGTHYLHAVYQGTPRQICAEEEISATEFARLLKERVGICVEEKDQPN